jgi:hypothetical protein
VLFYNAGHPSKVVIENREHPFGTEGFAHSGKVSQVRKEHCHFPLLTAERDLLPK